MSQIKCSNCDAFINFFQLKNDNCWSCGYDISALKENTEISPEDAKAIPNETPLKVESSEDKEDYKDEKQTLRVTNELTLKYSILKAFKGFLILSMIGSLLFTLDWFNTYLEMPQMAKDVLERVVWYVIIGCISSIFTMFCLIKMIDFLFDLDKNKSDK